MGRQMRTNHPALIAAVLGAGLAARAESPSEQEDLRRQIRDLKARVAALERQYERPPAAGARAVEEAVDEALVRDARRRSRWLADLPDGSAGYDRGFFIRSGDEWLLRPGAQLQFRGVLNYRDGTGEGNGDLESGFEIRRLRLNLDGTAFTRDLRYKFQWSSGTAGGDLRLIDAWVQYAFSDPWAVRVGQFKDPVHHEQLLSSRNQLAAERTLVNELIGGGINGRTQGFELAYGSGTSDDSPLNINFVLHDGAGQGNTGFRDDDFDFGASTRVEWKLFGPWAAYRDFSALRNKSELAVLGAAGSWSQSGDGDLVTATADFQWEDASGLGVYGAVLVARVDGLDEFALPPDTTWGALLQAGYLLSKSYEVFCRGGFVQFDDEQPLAGGAADDLFPEFTVGVNRFLGPDGSAGHRAKVTLDLSYFPQGVPAELFDPADLGATGDHGGDGEWVLRGQFQLVL